MPVNMDGADDDTNHSLLSALRENSSLQELSLESTANNLQALSRFLSATNSLQVLRLESSAKYCICPDLDAQALGKAISQCHTIKEIELKNISSSLMVSILQYGLINHPSVLKLSLRCSERQDLTAAVAVAL
jgi:hypothetical protein